MNNPLFGKKQSSAFDLRLIEKQEFEIKQAAQIKANKLQEREEHLALGGSIVGEKNEVAWHDNEGRYHRHQGPAYTSNQHKAWFVHGVRHREDGPAVETQTGRMFFWNGAHVDFEQYERIVKAAKDSKLDEPAEPSASKVKFGLANLKKISSLFDNRI